MCQTKVATTLAAWTFVAGLLLTAPLAAAYDSRSSVFPHRNDPLTPEYLTGTLTWNNGVGGVSWKENPQTEAVGGPASSPGEPNVPGTYNPCATSRVCPGPDAVFTSEPVPRRIPINTSRQIQVDLFPTGNARLDVELTIVNGDWIGGAIHGGWCGCSPGAPGCGCPQPTPWLIPFRFQSELAVIPANAVLRLTVKVYHQTDPFQHQFSEGKRSVLRIPFFSGEEEVFRLSPAYPDAAASSTGPAVGSSERLPAGAALSGLVLPLLAGRRRAAALLVTGTLVSLAGCTGPVGSPGDDGDGPNSFGGQANTTFQPIGGSGLGNVETGAVAGSVRDVVSSPVPGAHVSISELGVFMETTSFGRFSLRDIIPGHYVLTVEKTSYKAFRDSITVIANNITRIDIELEKLVPDPNQRHKHGEYWQGANTIPLLSDTLPPPCRPWQNVFGQDVDVPGLQKCDQNMAVSVPVRRAGMPNLVAPGTADVEVRLDFTGVGAPLKIGVKAQTNYGPALHMYPRLTGLPFHIQTGRELTDAGHQEFTTWAFSLFIWDDEYLSRDPHVQEDWETRITITLHRGVIPLEDAHPDRWGHNDTYVVFQRQIGSSGQAIHWNFDKQLAPMGFVPPGTKWLMIRQEMLADPFVTPIRWTHLQYRPANVPGACPDPPTVNECRVDGPPPETPEGSGLVTVWRLGIDESQTDPHYSRTPNWDVWSLEDSDPWVYYATTLGKVVYWNFTIIAHRDLMPMAP